ncbi:DUF3809 domain-containing protein [Deinococcus ficus]|uniref:DUF3809 domain-containing protein n=1 Tax=Deinococcus ficus TaxID=317577 RepID=A0A221STY2_9DEIO|nr:DUF3809 domain-containing protein [Deinococcus ficus]ASN80081.1 hypothetical protein DFI_02805 [Deinococcus ficus]
MILDAEQTFTLPHPGPHAAALAFVRSPAQALGQVRFLRALSAAPDGVRGELVVPLPVMGDADLPFHSRLHLTPDGAELHPEPLAGERAWMEVRGQAQVPGDPDGSGAYPLTFHFRFRAHLTLPATEGWGGAAFEKMVQAAAARTLDRVARELPAGIARALPGS